MGSNDDWKRLREAVEEALALDEAEREAYLFDVAERDASFGEEVRRLVALDGAAERFELPAPNTENGSATDASDVAGGGHIGPWELVREIGHGGMGRVWLARRRDGTYERRVALKVLRADVASEDVRERFKRERQVLANFEHPSIARLIEGGETREGVPYLVMEYVDGRPIHRYCDEERLPVEARIALFQEVCAAVHYAHTNLVVHRDLKPSNVLVNNAGVPKLLDFGIAKVLDPEKVSSNPDVTVGFVRFLTPAYASPEQIAGRPITTASDVYSLGALLYELLCGELPHDVETTSAAEMERIVCGTEPRRPSAVLAESKRSAEITEQRLTTPRGLSRTLWGDLDRIVLMALRKEPWRRYASAAELAEDLHRYRVGLPVRARPDTVGYVASRFVRRHKTSVAGGLLLLLSLLAGFFATWRQYGRVKVAESAERMERERAQDQLARAEKLALDLAEQKGMAERRLAEVEELNVELEAQRTVAAARFADIRRFATKMIFDVHRAIYRLEGATEATSLVAGLGVEYLDRLAAGVDASAVEDLDVLRREVAEGYVRLGEAQGLPGLSNLGDRQAALASIEKGRQLVGELRAESPEDPDLAILEAKALLRLGDLHRASGSPSEARAEYESALEACAFIADLEQPQAGELYTLGTVQRALSGLLASTGFEERGLELSKESIVVFERLVEGWPHMVSIEAELGCERVSLAGMLERQGELDEAYYEFEQAAEIFDRTEPYLAQNLPMRRNLELSRIAHAGFLIQHGDPQVAADKLDDALEFFETQSRRDPLNVQFQADQALVWFSMAAARSARDDTHGEREALTKLRVVAEDLNLADPDNASHEGYLAEANSRLAQIDHEEGLSVSANAQWLSARQIWERQLERDASNRRARAGLVLIDVRLGRAHREAGLTALAADSSSAGAARCAAELEQARAWFERAIATAEGYAADDSKLGLGWSVEELRAELELCFAPLE